MSKLLTILGIIFAALGVALGLMIFFSPSSVVGWGFTPQAAIELIVGGILAVGLGGVIDAVERIGATAGLAASAAPGLELQSFGRRAVETGMPAAAPAAMAAADDALSPATTETIRAIEDAKSEIHKAFGDAPAAEHAAEPAAAAIAEVPAAAEPAGEPLHPEHAEHAEEESEAAEDEADGQLYVVEEKLVRGRPARVLSDGTIEAETDEGWMRFENLEHLNEYLDAMAPGE